MVFVHGSAHAQPFTPPDDAFAKYIDRRYREGTEANASVQRGKLATVLAFAGGVLFFVGGIFVNLEVNSARDEAERKYDTYKRFASNSESDGNWAEFDSARDSAHTAATVRDVLYVGAGLAVATGVALLFLRPTKPTPRTYEAQDTTRSPFTPKVSAHGLSITF